MNLPYPLIPGLPDTAQSPALICLLPHKHGRSPSLVTNPPFSPSRLGPSSSYKMALCADTASLTLSPKRFCFNFHKEVVGSLASHSLFQTFKTPPPRRLEPLGCSISSLPGALFHFILAMLQSWLRISFDLDLPQSNMTPLFKKMTLLPLDVSAILAHGHTLGAAITPNSSTFKAYFPFSNLILILFREHPPDQSFCHLTTPPSQRSPVSSTSPIAFTQPNPSPKYLS